MNIFITSLSKRLKCEGWPWNLYWAFAWTRFSASLVNDVLWYASLPRKFTMALIVSVLLGAAWLFRPWLEVEEDIQE